MQILGLCHLYHTICYLRKKCKGCLQSRSLKQSPKKYSGARIPSESPPSLKYFRDSRHHTVMVSKIRFLLSYYYSGTNIILAPKGSRSPPDLHPISTRSPRHFSGHTLSLSHNERINDVLLNQSNSLQQHLQDLHHQENCRLRVRNHADGDTTWCLILYLSS